MAKIYPNTDLSGFYLSQCSCKQSFTVDPEIDQNIHKGIISYSVQISNKGGNMNETCMFWSQLSIGNHLISNAIWCKQAQVTSAYLLQIAREIILSLVNDLHEKSMTESRDIRNFDSARAICNLHSYYNFALVFHEKCTVSSQSDAHNLFSYIIK